MDYIETRKLLLGGFIGFLAVTALLAILCVISGEFGEIATKTLLSTLSVSCTSLCAMSCITFMEKRGANAVGVLGVAAAVLASLLMILGVWGNYYSDDFWKTVATLVLVSIGIAHALSLLTPDLLEEHHWIQAASSLAIMILVSQIVAAMWLEIADGGYYKLLTVVSIVTILLSLIVPICAKLNGSSTEDATATAETAEKLILSPLSGKTFVDETGRRFLVVELPADRGETSDG
jgi:hypothetical protein